MIGVGVGLVVVGVAAWALRGLVTSPPAASPQPQVARLLADAIATRVQLAQRRLDSGDVRAAVRDAESALKLDPANSDAKRVLDEASGLSLRGTFLISPQGMIMNSEVNFYNLGRNIEEILRKIIANKHLAANPAEACPAQWRKVGDITLKPSAKMVGKVSEAVKK